jgi:SNF2 family DNA or RNA helicase
VATSPEAIKRFLLYKPDLPPIEFRGAKPKDLLSVIHEDELLTKTTPRKHQLEGLAFAIWAKRALLFYEMRTGKTKIALDWLSYLIYSNRLHKRALIVAHAPIGVDEWQSQVPLHSFLRVRVVRSGNLAQYEFQQALHDRDVDAVLISWSTLQQIFSIKREAVRGAAKGKEKLYVNRLLVREAAYNIGAVVIDEIHMAGHYDTLRFGIASELVAHCQWRMGLTGTPFGRDPLLLWAQAYLIDAGNALSRSFFFFRDAFCTTKYNHFKWSKSDYVFDRQKLSLLREKMDAMTLHCELRDVQDVNVLSGVVRLSMGADQRLAYREAIDKLVQLRIGNTVEIENTFIRLRQIATGFLPFVNDAGEQRIVDFMDAAKFVWLEDFLSNLPDMQIVIFTDFVHTGQRIARLLAKKKVPYEWLHGGSKDRPSLLARFQSKEARILVSNTAAGGMAINLSVADYLMFFEPVPSVIMRKQAEARPLARGSRPLVIDDLVCAPIEQKILDFYSQGRTLLDAIKRNPAEAQDLLLDGRAHTRAPPS